MQGRNIGSTSAGRQAGTGSSQSQCAIDMSGGNKQQQQGNFSVREGKKSAFHESLFVALGVTVFLALVWIYAVQRLKLDHIQNPLLPDANTLDLSA